MAPKQVIEQALAALRQLAEAVPDSQRVQVAIREIERGFVRVPLAVGIRGAVPDRTRFVDYVAGGNTFDRLRRAAKSAPLRVRRGDGARYIALRESGPPEEHSLAGEPSPVKEDPAVAEIRSALADHVAAVARAEAALPADLQTRPPWWAFWRWIARLVRSLRYRREIKTLAAATAAETRARRELAALTDGREGSRGPFVDRLRELSAGGRAAADVVEIALHVPAGPLPEGVEVVELAGDGELPDLDGVLDMTGGALAASWATGDAEPVAIGSVIETVAGLPRLLAIARALRLAGRARDALDVAVAELDAELAGASAGFDARLAKLAAMRIPDPERFAANRLDRIAPQVGGTVSAVMEHATAHLGGDLAQLASDWTRAIEQAPTGGELGAAVAKINEESAARIQQIAEDVRILIMGGVGGCVRDLYPDLVAPLRDHGMTDAQLQPPKSAPALPKVEVLPSLSGANPSRFSGAGWFASLFKSLESRRAGIREKVERETKQLQEIATAEMLDAEPKLRAALRDALAAELATTIERQRTWLEAALAEEAATIAGEREILATKAAARDEARADSQLLSGLISELGAKHPAAAAAASHT
jgi:hypothetical protein